MNEGPCLACGFATMVERMPYPDRNRALRPDGTPVFLCDDCRSQARAGNLGAFSDEGLLRLRELGPLFGIEFAAVRKPRAHPATTPAGTATPKPKGAPAARVRPALSHH